MGKTFLGIFVLVVTVIASLILYNYVLTEFGEWGSFYNWLYMGCVTFLLGVGIFVSAFFIEKSIAGQNK